MSIPLHPMLVHLPIALTVLFPFLLVAFWLAERKAWVSEKIWFIALSLGMLTPLTAFLAIRTGEKDEELVEKILSEHLIEAHEEWGERVLWAGIAVFVLLLAAVLLKKVKALKWLAILASFAAIYPVIQAGHSGGALVYRHGAAQAHVQPSSVPSEETLLRNSDREVDDH